MHAKSGDEVRLGVCLGHGMEPSIRTGRIVGIRHNPEPGLGKYIYRAYREGDKNFPTGLCFSTSGVFLFAHDSTDDECQYSETFTSTRFFLS